MFMAVVAFAASAVGTVAPGRSIAGASTASADVQRFPDVVKVQLQATGGRRYRVTVTVSSPYDTPQRYADGWRVLDERKRQLGFRSIVHDHRDEQPFTRSLDGVLIPRSVKFVEIQARDQRYGWGGQTKKVRVPPSAQVRPVAPSDPQR